MQPIGQRILRLDEVSSTSTLILETPEYLEEHGLVVLARHQTGGRGRMGRQWASLPGQQLQFSLVLHPVFPPGDFPMVALVAGASVAQAVNETLGLEPRLKWPNDVLLNGRKVCGVLVEASTGAGGAPRLVVGIGVNGNGATEDFPRDLQHRLTTLSDATRAPVDLEALLAVVLQCLNSLYNHLASGNKAAVIDAWRRYGMLADGPRMRVRTAAGDQEGVPVDLTAEGYLIVRLGDGTERIQVSGEVAWVE